MPDTPVKVDYAGAAIAMDGLPDDVRQRLVTTVLRLQATDPATWSKDEVVRLPDPQPLYLLRLPPYRIILRRTESTELEIRDIFHEEALKLWANWTERNGGVQE